MLHALILALHSTVRWAVLLLAVASFACALHGLARRRAWTSGDAVLVRAWVGAADLQLLLGMTLYLGPVPRLRFFVLLHPLAMLGVIVLAHAASVSARRAGSSAQAFRRLASGATCALLLLAAAVPWPFYDVGRPLVRLP